MNSRTVEVEIDHGRVFPKGSEKLPEKGTGWLTILEPADSANSERKRIEAPLIRCKPATVIDPSPLELDASLWD
jgi:hypothetical protein